MLAREVRAFLLCARQGAFTWRWKSSTTPAGGIVSWTARVSTARGNLKEAVGKTLAWRTGIAYEAAMPDEKAMIFKVQYLHGRHWRRCGGHKRESGCAIPGEICHLASGLALSRGSAMRWQKSAEGIVGLVIGLKARTWSSERDLNFDDERDADSMAEMPESCSESSCRKWRG